MDSGNFNTLFGTVSFIREGLTSDRFDVFFDNKLIGTATEMAGHGVLYNHFIDHNNFITGVADTFKQAGEDLIDFYRRATDGN